MKNNIKISALVVAHNEENKLANCLKNLVYADELIVVLDKTAIPSFLPINPIPSFDLPLIDKIFLFIPVEFEILFFISST